MRFLKDRMSSISSDLYEEILKPNKSNTNRIIQIVPCKTALKIFHLRGHLGTIEVKEWIHILTLTVFMLRLLQKHMSSLKSVKVVFSSLQDKYVELLKCITPYHSKGDMYKYGLSFKKLFFNSLAVK